MKNLTAIMAAAIAGTAIISTNFTVAADEVPNRPPRVFHVPEAPPRFIANHVGSVGTAFSAAGHARADQIRAWADYQEALSRAALNHEIARQVYIESKLRVVRNRDELRAAHIEAWAAREPHLARKRARGFARRAAVAEQESSPGLYPAAGFTQVVP